MPLLLPCCCILVRLWSRCGAAAAPYLCYSCCMCDALVGLGCCGLLHAETGMQEGHAHAEWVAWPGAPGLLACLRACLLAVSAAC